MKCRKVQELILTVYLDDEIDGKQKMLVDEHLALCPECKKFYLETKGTVKDVFERTERLEVPDGVWQKIKGAIIEEKQKKVFFVPDFLRILSAKLRIPRPVLAVASVAVLLIVFGAVMFGLKGNGGTFDLGRLSAIEYFGYTMEIPADSAGSGFGTNIEECFL